MTDDSEKRTPRWNQEIKEAIRAKKDKKRNQADTCATIGIYKISRLLFTDSLVLLSSTEAGLRRTLNSFADACDTAGMKNENKHGQTDVLHLSRNPDQ